MSVNNHLKRQWTDCSNQKTQNGKLDNKRKAYNMLPTRDPLQSEERTQTEGKEGKKILHVNGNDS